jgi:hypothetical protein
MIRVTVHRKFGGGSPSLSVSPRRGFRTFENAASSAMRLLADETRQPGHEQIAEYVVTYRWDTGRVQRDYYRATCDGPPEYLRSEALEEIWGVPWAGVGTAAPLSRWRPACTSRRGCFRMDVLRECVSIPDAG